MDTQSLMDELTMAGLEVDGSMPVAAKFSGVVVGEVLATQKHPDADKLSLCEVSDGNSTFQVVCGAPNVRSGLKAPFAKVGAEIYSESNETPLKIKAAKLRGVESNGMLCSAEELGLGTDADGLLELSMEAPVGVDIREFLNLDDVTIELDLTPNRGDCLGMIGLAREVAVLSMQEIKSQDSVVAESKIPDEFSIEISAAMECPRYLGRIIRNVNLDSKSPFWMQEKLRRSGLRSIDPIVDVTNYVLMELGQPMHAFDFAKLEGGIDVRLASKNESIVLLDGKEVELTPDTLVIADKKKAVAIAGIMGGLATSVSAETKDVFLECAFFSPIAVAGKARSYGMHTDASHRYERGVDYQLQHRAMERATQLLLDIVGGEAGPISEAIGQLPEAKQVRLKFNSVSKLLGITLENKQVVEILTQLGFNTAEKTDKDILLDVPSFRFDIAIEADLIEEVARIYGYNKLPNTKGLANHGLNSHHEAHIGLPSLRGKLVSLGYQEVITYSFIDPELSKLIVPSKEAIRLQNPISEEMSVMRSSILPGLLNVLIYNENRQKARMRLFETGLIFSMDNGEIQQEARIAGLVSGDRFPDNWLNNKEISDFYDVKGDVESLLELGGKKGRVQFVPASHESFHSGQCAEVLIDGAQAGFLGALHPAIQRKLDLKGATYLFELKQQLVQEAQLPLTAKLSKFPEVNRDLAVVLEESVSSADILSSIRQEAGEFLTELRIIDVYQGDAVKKGEKSLALGLTWQHPSRTLSDEEINTIISSCVNALHEQFNANLRN